MASDNSLSVSAIELLLSVDDTCAWVDALGRRILLRRNALFGEAETYLECVNDSELNNSNKKLKKPLIDIIDVAETELHFIESFVLPGDGREEKDLSIPIFSSITHHHHSRFLIHLILVCGEYGTELDICKHPIMCDSPVAYTLIEENTDVASLQQYSCDLVNLVIKHIMPV